MIGTRNIRVHAANPNIPLQPVFAFRGSPVSVRLIDVPRRIGQWKIAEVSVTAAYPDNSLVTKKCVLVGGCWVGTLAGKDAAGKTAKGFTITADGTDEDGNETKGYVLGVGDLVLLDRDATAAAEQTSHYIHLLEEKPESPNEGDAYLEADILNVFVGGSWFPIPDADSVMDEVKDIRESTYTMAQSDAKYLPKDALPNGYAEKDVYVYSTSGTMKKLKVLVKEA